VLGMGIGLGLGLGLGSHVGLGLGLDVAGRRHERGFGARGQQRLDAAERAALVRMGAVNGAYWPVLSIGDLGRCYQ